MKKFRGTALKQVVRSLKFDPEKFQKTVDNSTGVVSIFRSAHPVRSTPEPITPRLSPADWAIIEVGMNRRSARSAGPKKWAQTLGARL